ncbi:MAG TPA: phosphate-starvation-inducible PsiE family protein, partial [Methanothrix sp.]|nr:phosphate-starvation-inducible PsiE family protein [Methanothrix sp.]
TVDLVYVLARDLILPPIGLQISESLNFFGLILLVLIGVELLETFKSFGMEKSDSVLVVILIAIIAVGRRIVQFELNGDSDEIVLASLGVIMISLAAAYYLVKKS